jgi:hypothetical protein
MIGKQAQYYTMSGNWMHQSSQRAKFCVPGFLDARELDPLLSFLPGKGVPGALQNKLQSFEHALPREVGSPLIKKMLDFWKEADRLYRVTAFKLDNAHRLVAHKSTLRYTSLLELASELLPHWSSKNGSFSDPLLYALHRSLMEDNIGFRPQNCRDRTVAQFEISSIDEVETIKSVSAEVRKYQAYLMSPSEGVKKWPIARLLHFITKARRLIRDSRKTRQYTAHGTIGPAKPIGDGKANTDKYGPGQSERFTEADQYYIRFIESWAGLRTIQNHSHLHGTASAILRATGMYEDIVLDQRVGWTFLKEIGAITPWGYRVHFDLRLPHASRAYVNGFSGSLQPLDHDALEGLRKDWDNLPVYCIDDIGAKEIDDGVSIEPTDSSDEYWIHVHTADPASKIAPRSALAQRAEFMVRTLYFPEDVRGMLPKFLVGENFSLAPGEPYISVSVQYSKLIDI